MLTTGGSMDPWERRELHEVHKHTQGRRLSNGGGGIAFLCLGGPVVENTGVDGASRPWHVAFTVGDGKREE